MPITPKDRKSEDDIRARPGASTTPSTPPTTHHPAAADHHPEPLGQARAEYVSIRTSHRELHADGYDNGEGRRQGSDRNGGHIHAHESRCSASPRSIPSIGCEIWASKPAASRTAHHHPTHAVAGYSQPKTTAVPTRVLCAIPAGLERLSDAPDPKLVAAMAMSMHIARQKNHYNMRNCRHFINKQTTTRHAQSVWGIVVLAVAKLQGEEEQQSLATSTPRATNGPEFEAVTGSASHCILAISNKTASRGRLGTGMPSTAAPGPASDHAAPRHLSQSECGLLEE
ncbi:hypothetical protein CORC01_10087 [Colletotrichum orchidophilum]|uniref:Uncharacterized protein n=1 Tax=Colletotrichum orchidophilum TaxID=1209926 RepID=A0A1G4AZG2_9PEZI|nr:uncharacterized protein CORC01_10087 [Colletotrichum orchidophilum]OHE94559.1 hypothetical protein CORC01_10087 [Colletotrichum orchidophilum]